MLIHEAELTILDQSPSHLSYCRKLHTCVFDDDICDNDNPPLLICNTQKSSNMWKLRLTLTETEQGRAKKLQLQYILGQIILPLTLAKL